MSKFSNTYGNFQYHVEYTQEGNALLWQAVVYENGRMDATRGGRLHAKEGQAPFGDDDVRVAVQDSIDKWQEYRRPGEVTPYTDFD